MNRTRSAVFAFVLPLLVAGCGNKGSGGGDAAGSAPGGGSGKGIDAPGNDPAVVALAKKAMTCKWGTNGFAYDCADKKAWDSASELLKGGKADATLIAMLEDGNEQVRWLAAKALNGFGDAYRGDKALAPRALDAALAEKSKIVGRDIGNAAGRMKLAEIGLVDRAKALGKAPTLKEVRLGFLDAAQFNSRDAFYAYTLDLAKNDADKDIRMTAMGAFWTGTPSGKGGEVCALWFDLSHDANEDLASHAAYYLSFTSTEGGCKAQWDGMLGDIEKRAKAGTAKAPDWANALYYLHGHKNVSPAQQARAMAIAKILIENTANGGSSRSRALELVAEKDPGAKAYLTRFLNDSDSYIKGRAESLLKKVK